MNEIHSIVRTVYSLFVLRYCQNLLATGSGCEYALRSAVHRILSTSAACKEAGPRMNGRTQEVRAWEIDWVQTHTKKTRGSFSVLLRSDGQCTSLVYLRVGLISCRCRLLLYTRLPPDTYPWRSGAECIVKSVATTVSSSG